MEKYERNSYIIWITLLLVVLVVLGWALVASGELVFW